MSRDRITMAGDEECALYALGLAINDIATERKQHGHYNTYEQSRNATTEDMAHFLANAFRNSQYY